MSKDKSQILPELLPIEKSIYEQINTVKNTIIKIFINRGFINKENEQKYIDKLVKSESDEYEYIINLDNDSNYNTIIKNKKIYVKIFNYKITSINKNSSIGEFINKYDKDYKFIVVQDINSKSENLIESYQTDIEIFKFNKLLINIIENNIVPQHIVLNQEEGQQVLETYRARKRDMMLIKSSDVVAKYYKMKPGDIVKIIRPSVITCEAIAYRLVFKSKDTKAKT